MSASPEFSRPLSGLALQSISIVLPFVDYSTAQDEEEEEVCRTPTDRKSRLAFEATSCPPAPKKPPGPAPCKRRLLELELVSVRRLEEIENWFRSKECDAKRRRRQSTGRSFLSEL